MEHHSVQTKSRGINSVRAAILIVLLALLVLVAAILPFGRVVIVGASILLFILASVIYIFGRSPHPTEESERKLECAFGTSEIGIPLKPAFRFAHEPLHAASNGRFVGRKAELEALVLRILFSEGGSFLVTGYRGVGKTSYVNQVVCTLKELVPWAEDLFDSSIEIIDVQFNLARPLNSGELMHHIIRRLVEELRHKGIYSRLEPSLRKELSLAYDRTSVNMSRTLNEEN